MFIFFILAQDIMISIYDKNKNILIENDCKKRSFQLFVCKGRHFSETGNLFRLNFVLLYIFFSTGYINQSVTNMTKEHHLFAF